MAGTMAGKTRQNNEHGSVVLLYAVAALLTCSKKQETIIYCKNRFEILSRLFPSYFCSSRTEYHHCVPDFLRTTTMIPTWSKLLQAGGQSGVIMGTADALTQLFIEREDDADLERDDDHLVSSPPFFRPSSPHQWDMDRTLRWTLCGLTLHGPYFATGFGILDRYIGRGLPSITLQTVVYKTMAAQLVLFPPYLVLLFTYLGFLESNPDIMAKVCTHVPQAFWVGCGYWPVVNTLNFAFVPQAFRVPYLATTAGVWNGYLSWSNHRK